MIYLDEPARLYGVDAPSATYWPTDREIEAVNPILVSRILRIGHHRLLFLDDALPLDVYFHAPPKFVASLNRTRRLVGLPPTQPFRPDIQILTPVPTHPIQ